MKMNSPSLLQKCAIAGIASAAALSFPINANASTFLIDNYEAFSNFDATDATTPDGTIEPVTEAVPLINTQTDLPGDWILTLSASALEDVGTAVRTSVNGSSGTASLESIFPGSGPLGEYGFIYSTQFGVLGNGIDISSFDGFMFDWISANEAGTTINVLVEDQSILSGGAFTLPENETGTPIQYTLELDLSNIGDPTDVKELEILYSGVRGLDAEFDNVKLVGQPIEQVPEPGTVLGLLAVGGLGLGLKRKKQSEKTNQT